MIPTNTRTLLLAMLAAAVREAFIRAAIAAVAMAAGMWAVRLLWLP